MAEYLIQDTTLTGIANAIRGKTGGADPITVSDMANQIAGISGSGSGGVTLPSGIYLKSLGISNRGTVHQLPFVYNNELYVISNTAAGRTSTKNIHKLVNGSWTKLVNSQTIYNSSRFVPCVEYNGKMHFFISKAHCTFDGVTLAKLTDLPNSPSGNATFVYNNELYIHIADSKALYKWSEETDTLTEVLTTSSYVYYNFYKYNNEIYAFEKAKIYKFVDGTMQQVFVSNITNPYDTRFCYGIGKYMYYCNQNMNTNAQVGVYRYDIESNTETKIGYLPMGMTTALFFMYGGKPCFVTSQTDTGTAVDYVEMNVIE